MADEVDDLLELGCARYDEGQFAEAETCFRKASELESPEGAFNLGNSLVKQERWDAAVVAYELALERGETEAWLNLGRTLSELGDFGGELWAYQQSDAAGDSGGTLALAFALREQGDRDAAMAAAERSASAGNSMAAGVVACWHWDLTCDPGLEDALRAGADHYPSARSDLAALLIATDRLDEARHVLVLGMALGEVESMLPLGNLYADLLDDPVAAEDAYLAGIAKGDAFSHHNLAVLLEQQGDLQRAEDHYRLAIAGGDDLAVKALRELLDEN